jgi:hypothetical protein
VSGQPATERLSDLAETLATAVSRATSGLFEAIEREQQRRGNL